jgi:hypothetical protein
VHALSLRSPLVYNSTDHLLAQDHANAVRRALERLDTPPDEMKAFQDSVIAYLRDHLIPEFDKYEFYAIPLVQDKRSVSIDPGLRALKPLPRN